MTSNQLAKAVNSVIRGAVKPEEHADMPALTVKKEHLVEVCRLLRDQHGKNFLSAVSAVDYLGYGEPVAGLLRHRARPRHQRHRQLGRPETSTPPEKRFGVVYHLAHYRQPAADRPTGCG